MDGGLHVGEDPTINDDGSDQCGLLNDRVLVVNDRSEYSRVVVD